MDGSIDRLIDFDYDDDDDDDDDHDAINPASSFPICCISLHISNQEISDTKDPIDATCLDIACFHNQAPWNIARVKTFIWEALNYLMSSHKLI